MASRSAPTSRPPAIILLTLALLLPLIVACGGSSASAPQAGVSLPAATRGPVETSGGVAAAPTAAAAAPATPAAAPGADAAAIRSEPTAAPAAAVAPEAPAEAAGVAAPIGMAAQPTPPAAPQPPVVAQQQQFTPLKAGQVDDNADFPAYLAYLQAYHGPVSRPVDVSERYILSVTNQYQQPILDARVRLFDDQQHQLFDGRTVAGGKTIVFPRALGIPAAVSTLQVLIEKGNSTVQGTLTRGQDSTQSFVLPDAEPLPQTPRLDVLFLLDATGSMGDEISQIQQTIASIAARIDQLEPRPELRFGLVAYRDRGDEYVTRVYDFSPDLVTFQQLLRSVRADGGGDEPESLNEGLHAAIEGVSWGQDAVRLVFLVADAPPHLDYAQDYDYVQELRVAVAKGVKVYPIAASNSGDEAEYVFRQLAQQTLGQFIFLTYQPGQNAGAPGDTTTHQVDPAAFTVERLDDLVVQVVEHELALAQGKA